MDTMSSAVRSPSGTELAEWGVATRALEAGTQSGDRHAVVPYPGGLLAAVADGLGHGDEAAAAAKIAIRTLEASPTESITSLVQRCHQVLQGTRGAAITLASLNATDGTLSWLGIGNVEGILLCADPQADPRKIGIMAHSGVVGYRIPRMRVSVLPLERGDTLILATDGIRSGFTDALAPEQPPQRNADRILQEYGKSIDDALVLVVRYLGLGQGRHG